MNPYEVSIDGAQFSTFCGGNLGGEHETCFSVAEIPGASDAYVVKDDKPEGAGKELRGSGAELDAFALGWAKTRGLTL